MINPIFAIPGHSRYCCMTVCDERIQGFECLGSKWALRRIRSSHAVQQLDVCGNDGRSLNRCLIVRLPKKRMVGNALFTTELTSPTLLASSSSCSRTFPTLYTSERSTSYGSSWDCSGAANADGGIWSAVMKWVVSPGVKRVALPKSMKAKRKSKVLWKGTAGLPG